VKRPLTAQDLEAMRQDAKRLKKAKPGLRHTAALDLVATEAGYKHWGEALAAANGSGRYGQAPSTRKEVLPCSD
jgi:hypothetical protein